MKSHHQIQNQLTPHPLWRRNPTENTKGMDMDMTKEEHGRQNKGTGIQVQLENREEA
jgi:hypothetical protein